MQAIYDVKTDKLTIIGNRNNGQARMWTIIMRWRKGDGSITSRTYKPDTKCFLKDILEIIQKHSLIEYLEDDTVRYDGFTAIAR